LWYSFDLKKSPIEAKNHYKNGKKKTRANSYAKLELLTLAFTQRIQRHLINNEMQIQEPGLLPMKIDFWWSCYHELVDSIDFKRNLFFPNGSKKQN